MYHIKLIWIWLRENWRIPFLIVWSIVIWALSRKNAQAAMDVLEARKESYDKQIIELKENHQKELSARDIELKKYHETLDLIEKKYNEKSVKITKEKKERVKQLVKESNENPDHLKQKIEELFGLSDLG